MPGYPKKKKKQRKKMLLKLKQRHRPHSHGLWMWDMPVCVFFLPHNKDEGKDGGEDDH